MLAKQSSGAVLDLRDHLTPTRSRPGTGDINADCAEKLPAAKLHNSLQCLLPLRVEKARALWSWNFCSPPAFQPPPELFPAGPVASKFFLVFVFFIFSQPTKTTSC